MEWFTKVQPKRDQYWPEIEQFFSNLPQPLFRQGRLLRTNLAFRYSETGQFKDILSRSCDYPLLDLHFWLLDDLNVPVGGKRAQLEKHLLQAILFSFATIYTQESILDETSLFDNEYLLLAQVLAKQAVWHLVHLFPATSPFWQYHQTFWNDYAETTLWKYRKQPPKVVPPGIEEAPLTGQLAPAKIIAAAVAIKSGHETKLPQLFTLLEHLNFIFQTKWDISTIRRDLMQGNYTYPVVRTMMEAGMTFQSPVEPVRVMGAMVLTDSVAKICQECLDHVDAGRTAADALNLPTVKAYLVAVEEMLQELLDLFSFTEPAATQKRTSTKKKPLSIPFFIPYSETLPRAIQMAEGYLLSDLTFRDSWEVHRHGMFDVPEVISKFPSGLVIEILCQNEHDLSEQVDTFFQERQAAQFNYFEHAFLYPDTDSLGLLLRLYRYSTQKEAHRNMLKVPLRWLKANIRKTGQIPVWLTRDIDLDNDDKPPALLLGENCGVVETHLLLGLIDYAWSDYQDIIEKSAAQLLDRVIVDGYGITVNYPQLYIPGIVFRLISKLSTQPVRQALKRRMSEATETLVKRLEVETKRHIVTPQDAAFLILSCLNPFASHMFNPRWLTVLLKNHRSDGSWYGEPVFFVINRDQVVTWYASHSLTTAFCYHALKTYAQWKDQANR